MIFTKHLLILGFILGILIDFSTNSPGVHASATLAIAFLRPYILAKMAPRQGYDLNSQPMLAYYGFRWFFQYALIFVSIHHTILFFNLSFSFDESLFLIIRAVINIFFTMLTHSIKSIFSYKKNNGFSISQNFNFGHFYRCSHNFYSTTILYSNYR